MKILSKSLIVLLINVLFVAEIVHAQYNVWTERFTFSNGQQAIYTLSYTWAELEKVINNYFSSQIRIDDSGWTVRQERELDRNFLNILKAALDGGDNNSITAMAMIDQGNRMVVDLIHAERQSDGSIRFWDKGLYFSRR